MKSLIVSLAGLAATTFANGISAKLRMPERGQIVGMTMNVAAKGGTHSNSSIDVKNGAGTSLLAAAFDVDAATAGTPVDKEGSGLSAAAAAVAKDDTIVITTAESGGTSPTVTGLTVQIDYVPLGD